MQLPPTIQERVDEVNKELLDLTKSKSAIPGRRVIALHNPLNSVIKMKKLRNFQGAKTSSNFRFTN